jgi:hypothetical protein
MAPRTLIPTALEYSVNGGTRRFLVSCVRQADLLSSMAEILDLIILVDIVTKQS